MDSSAKQGNVSNTVFEIWWLKNKRKKNKKQSNLGAQWQEWEFGMQQQLVLVDSCGSWTPESKDLKLMNEKGSQPMAVTLMKF